MTSLQETVDAQVEGGVVPGAVALVACGDEVTVAGAGVRSPGGPAMARDSLFRIASLTKPITAAATMALVDRGRLALDEPVARWLPELAEPSVLRTPSSEPDDVVPAVRPITVRQLLTFQGGHGFPSDFTLPVVESLFALGQGPPQPQAVAAPDEWMARLADIPLLHQPGEGWTYNTGSDVLGVLLARAEGRPLDEVLEDTVLGPVGMADTGFAVPVGGLDRMTSSHRRDPDTGGLELVDPPDGQWARPPAFPSGASGLVSTADDWLAFGRMLLAGGTHRGRRVLSAEAVRQMTTCQAEAEPDSPFLRGQGWGFGGSVDLVRNDPWEVPGRYGWVGGTGTAGHVVPSRDAVVVWMSQVELAGPDDAAGMAAVLTWAAEATAP
ncbi:serine hydrolase [Iamia majanohamensis]|uniref:Serine hydrolase n=1 Tax=Iamia majanohamensis TaxID=467976 RepID=A0AAE9YIP3_9ACTN|nr:serine hydrolase domain-containing protein [Iamia majanohamensis]WCO68696.1 serine hydrolase [Iamia majanohamensis]